ncbi:MAG: hypothetical protein JXA92_12605 [candidate division Zixibacteria bacterium]|nr:hypothetical protein [candidate division Zixibacteria bacterium]
MPRLQNNFPLVFFIIALSAIETIFTCCLLNKSNSIYFNLAVIICMTTAFIVTLLCVFVLTFLRPENLMLTPRKDLRKELEILTALESRLGQLTAKLDKLLKTPGLTPDKIQIELQHMLTELQEIKSGFVSRGI